jgi:hypothetical protein
MQSVVDVEENEEVENPWIVAEQALSDEEKLTKLKDLARYANSDEFSILKDKFALRLESLRAEIRELAYSRVKCEATKSVLDEYVVIIKALEEIAEEVTNETFKEYLLLSRLVSYESAVVNKKGHVVRGQSEMPFDMPIYTEIDMLKEKASMYHSIEALIGFLMSTYDIANIMDGIRKLRADKKKESENEHQPY